MNNKEAVYNELNDYLKNLFTEERLREMIEFLPRSKSGSTFLQKLLGLKDLIERMSSVITTYPLIVETLVSISKNVPSGELLTENVGIFSGDEVFDLFRANYINENDHLGRYFISWYVISLISYVDKYIEEFAKECSVDLSKKQLRWEIKRKMKFILLKLSLWEDFKEEKESLPELVTLFNKIIEARHKVAHHEVALEWSKEILDKHFKIQQKEHTGIQTDLLEIMQINDDETEIMDIKPFTEFISVIRAIGDIVLGYIGFFDNFIISNLDVLD